MNRPPQVQSQPPRRRGRHVRRLPPEISGRVSSGSWTGKMQGSTRYTATWSVPCASAPIALPTILTHPRYSDCGPRNERGLLGAMPSVAGVDGGAKARFGHRPGRGASRSLRAAARESSRQRWRAFGRTDLRSLAGRSTAVRSERSPSPALRAFFHRVRRRPRSHDLRSPRCRASRSASHVNGRARRSRYRSLSRRRARTAHVRAFGTRHSMRRCSSSPASRSPTDTIQRRIRASRCVGSARGRRSEYAASECFATAFR
jgi:hypothetical protein